MKCDFVLFLIIASNDDIVVLKSPCVDLKSHIFNPMVQKGRFLLFAIVQEIQFNAYCVGLCSEIHKIDFFHFIDVFDQQGRFKLCSASQVFYGAIIERLNDDRKVRVIGTNG